MSTLWHFPPCSFFLNWLSHFSPLYYSKLFRSDPVYKDLVIVYSSAASDFSFLCRDGSGNNLTQTLVWNLNPTRTWPHPSPAQTRARHNPTLTRTWFNLDPNPCQKIIIGLTHLYSLSSSAPAHFKLETCPKRNIPKLL